MKRIALIIALLFGANANAFTLTPHGGGFTLLICDDVVFTHYGKPQGGLVHGKQVPQGAFVLTCPRTNATWSLTILGCPTHKVSAISWGNYAFTC